MTQRWPLILGFFAGIAAVAAGLSQGASPVEGWQLAARWTAKLGFAMLLITYSASSLARLWRGPATQALLRQRRWWGLGFAACHTAHLVALVTFLRLSGEARPVPILLFAGGAYATMYAMALTSSDRAMRALGRSWKRLHTLGIHWLWLIFLASYGSRLFKPEQLVSGVLGTSLALGALALRIAARRKAQRA